MFMTGINPHVFFAIQVVADVVLCLAVVFIIARVNQDLKKRKSFVKTMAELKRLIEESQKATGASSWPWRKARRRCGMCPFPSTRRKPA